MKIGFFGNANNYPFTLARTIRKMGHDVRFVVDAKEPLNRPENRYKEISTPYPDWIIDCSPLDGWRYPPSTEMVDKAVRLLSECDALVLNEFGLMLWDKIRKPTFALLTGTDLQVLADYRYADLVIGAFNSPLKLIKRCMRLKKWMYYRQLVRLQRLGIRNAVGFTFFTQGMVEGGDRLLEGIGVDQSRRIFFLQADIETYDYALYPQNKILRLFNIARIQWIKPNHSFISELDYKGTDLLIKGLGQFLWKTKLPVDIRLVKKGVHLDETVRLIEQEGISDKITWLEHMNQIKLIEEYQNADIVFDQFGNGSIGMGALDAMATGRPVIANGKPHIFNREFGESLPICQAATPDEICDQLTRLAQDRSLREKIGFDSRKYVEKYFSPERAAGLLLEKLEAAFHKKE